MMNTTDNGTRSIPGIDPEELNLLTIEEIDELENLEYELAPIMGELDNPARSLEELALEQRVLRRAKERLGITDKPAKFQYQCLQQRPHPSLTPADLLFGRNKGLMLCVNTYFLFRISRSVLSRLARLGLRQDRLRRTPPEETLT